LLAAAAVGLAAATYDKVWTKAAAAPDPQSISVCFAPEGDCAALIKREIAYADQMILVHAYSFTTGPGIAEALIVAKRHGIDVRVIADRSTPCANKSAIPILVAADIPVWIDDTAKTAHEKALIIDGKTVVEGSYNFTASAAENSEDLMIIRSPALASQYERHWRDRYDKSTRVGATGSPKEWWSWCVGEKRNGRN
jgi:phosphatidylserine/phosphatidylglycerophosphate/cardiolipin synthase-like enzyme